ASTRSSTSRGAWVRSRSLGKRPIREDLASYSERCSDPASRGHRDAGLRSSWSRYRATASACGPSSRRSRQLKRKGVPLADAARRVVLARRLLDGPQSLAALPPPLIRTLLVPGVGLGQAEDAAVVALALEAAQCGFEGLVRTDLDFDHTRDSLG